MGAEPIAIVSPASLLPGKEPKFSPRRTDEGEIKTGEGLVVIAPCPMEQEETSEKRMEARGLIPCLLFFVPQLFLTFWNAVKLSRGLSIALNLGCPRVRLSEKFRSPVSPENLFLLHQQQEDRESLRYGSSIYFGGKSDLLRLRGGGKE